MYCSKCGSQNVNGEIFCKNCGTLLENIQPQQPVNNINGQMQQPINNGVGGPTNQQPMYNQQQSVNNMNDQVQQPINNGIDGSVNQQPMYNQQQSVNNMNSQMQQPINNGVAGPMNQQYSNTNGNLDYNYVNQAVNPNMKIWAILSIVIPVAAIVWYWFIGLSFYLAILIAGVGFGFAEKGKMSDKKLAIIGKVCNGVLVGLAIIMFILQLIGIFA